MVVVLGGIAHSAPVADEDPTSRARQLFDSGRRHFELTEYDAALVDFKEGYRLKDDPVFLYNIGLCHRLLGRKSEALQFFKNYLNRRPDAPNRDDLERKIAALDQEIASEQKARLVAGVEKPPPPADARLVVVAPADARLVVAAPVPPRRPVYKRWWLWTTVAGVVVVGVAVGLGVGLTQTNGSHYGFARLQF